MNLVPRLLRANLREARRSLLAARQRNALALLGIVIGVGAVIAMVSVGTMVGEEAMRQFRELGTDVITIHKEWQGPADRKVPFTAEDALLLPLKVGTVRGAAPVIVTGGNFVYGGRPLGGGVLGVSGSFVELNKLTLRAGRFISDFDRYRQFAVIGAELFRQMGADEETKIIGRPIRVVDRVFTVVGVMEPAPRSSMLSYDVNNSIMIPVSTAGRMFGRDGVDTVTARLIKGAEHQSAAEQVKRFFEYYADGLKVRVTTAEELIAGMDKQARMFTLLLGAVGSISLVVGGVGIMNVMLVSVSERRREVGIRRALGARQSDIRTQFVVEALILALAGGILGVVAGIGTSYLIAQLNGWQFVVSWPAAVSGVAVSSLIGLFFGFYPAHKASRVDPIAALRSD